jgi:autoinducer 2-degrading protein
MRVMHVHIRVKPGNEEEFINATEKNVRHSIREEGIVRFDLIQSADDPSLFMLVEVYRNEEAVTSHKQSSHYAVWKDTVADMMAEPRKALWYETVFPEPALWETIRA